MVKEPFVTATEAASSNPRYVSINDNDDVSHSGTEDGDAIRPNAWF